MRRACAILKYLPAVLCVLLVVAWVVSPIQRLGLMMGQTAFDFNEGSIRIWHNRFGPPRYFDPLVNVTQERSLVGHFEYSRLETYFVGTACPIAFVLTILAPCAVGPFTRFRFPLWSYFAWTALVAAELAYYLR
jgi:hypothetical protein